MNSKSQNLAIVVNRARAVFAGLPIFETGLSIERPARMPAVAACLSLFLVCEILLGPSLTLATPTPGLTSLAIEPAHPSKTSLTQATPTQNAQPRPSQEPKPLVQAPPRNIDRLKPPSVPFELGPVVPGLRQKAIPQGLTYLVEENKIIISHYFEDAPSRISIIDNSTQKITASIILKESRTKFHGGHVGGVTRFKNSLWIASGRKILEYKLAPLLSAPAIPTAVKSPTAVPVAIHSSVTKASFCTATPDMLFVGEFANGISHPTDRSHHVTDRRGIKKTAWVCGYSNGPSQNPTCVLSIRRRVQGMHVTDRHIFLSLSYGRKNRSTIVVYRNPLHDDAHTKTTLPDGTQVPLWFLDGENYLAEIDFPPMAEGITMIGDRLAVLSESGADKYLKNGKGPLDSILLLDVSQSVLNGK